MTNDENFNQVTTAQSRYRLLAENMCDLVCLHAPDGRYDYVSPSVEALLGFRPHELVGMSPYDLIHPEETACVREDMFERLPKAEDALTVDYRMRKKSGEYVWVETVPRLVTVTDGEPARILTVSRDITKRKTAERELAAAEEEIAKIYFSEQAARAEAEAANRAKDEFLQLISHEFRTPLTTVKTLARVMQQGGETTDERAEYLETIVAECDRQIGMVENLLDIARLEADSLNLRNEPVDTSRVLRSCDQIERHAANARQQIFDVAYDENLPPARGDEKAIRRALCAIIENAIKYTPVGGKIEIFAERHAPDEEKDSSLNSAVEAEIAIEEIAVVVSDTGRGIDPEDVPRLFRKFFRGKNAASRNATPENAAEHAETSGVGLGLYLANHLIAQLGGRIEIESEIGRGSRFSVFLPVYDERDHHVGVGDSGGIAEGEMR